MQRIVVSVKGLIVRNHKLLVLMKSSGNFDLPGGRVECGESFEESLHREVKEETGLLQGKNMKPLVEWSFIKN